MAMGSFVPVMRRARTQCHARHRVAVNGRQRKSSVEVAVPRGYRIHNRRAAALRSGSTILFRNMRQVMTQLFNCSQKFLPFLLRLPPSHGHESSNLELVLCIVIALIRLRLPETEPA